jgi:polysaccharide biosynthesis/export protein
MLRQINIILSTILFSLCLSGTLVSAQTAQQIEQFKRLPKAQQEQLAKQMGVDLSAISGLNSTTGSQQKTEISKGPYPRGTTFDEFGNPINSDIVNDKSLFPEEVEELKLFGAELFANSPSTFSPMSDVPVPANYIISPGDELVVQLFGKENEEYRLKVGRDGNIVIPKLGPVSIATLTFSEAKLFLAEQIKKQIIGVEVSLTMGELTTMRVFVMGEAYKPGAYNISSLSTITHALFASGGVSDIASLRNIQLKRAGKLVTTLDLYDLLNSGDTSNDLQLRAGDAIFIPPISRTVTVDGKVRRPAIYELKNEQTLSEVIKLAGGKLPEGYDAAVGIKRFKDGSQIQLTADINKQDINILSGDYITVPEISPVITDSITLIGAVARPGSYQWEEGIKLFDIISNPKKDLLEIADLTYILVLRDINKNRDIEILQVDLSGLSNGSSDNNLAMNPNDRILVFSKIESEDLSDVHIEDMAYRTKELVKREKDLWEKRIEDNLFWKSVGLYEDNNSNTAVNPESELYLLQNQPIIQLTDEEKQKILEYKDFTFFSRKRMLVPVIEKLRDQAKQGEPIQLVEIAGEVKVPGVYPLVKNASIHHLIKAAGGLTESSYLKKSEITRSAVSAEGVAQISHISFSPSDIINDNNQASAIKLKSKDRVNIFSIPSWQEELKVTVKGEVEFPGEYTIRRGETIADLLKRVGNLTEYGDPDAVIFTRETLKVQERKNLQKLAEDLRKQIASESLRRNTAAGSIVSYDESKKLLKDLTSVEAVGRLVIDLSSIIAGQPQSDVVLENGDVLYVPGRSQTINVIGEVYVPTSHLFTSGLSYEDYILKSGGYKTLADEDKTYIIRANGSVEVPNRDGGYWFGGDKQNIGILPGDTIVVPFDANDIDNMTLWANATQIIYQLAVAVAAIGSL